MNNHKSFKVILAVLTLLVFGMIFVHYFLYRNIKLMNESASILSSQVSLQSEREGYLISTQRAIQNLEPELDKINIISKDGDVDFIEGLESLARQNNLSINIDSLVREENKNSGPVSTLKISLTTKGSWTSTYKFLLAIESLPYKVKINEYSFANELSGDTKPLAGNSWQSKFKFDVLEHK